ncbi:MAG: fused MFS/spermidine synthase [Candidatus Omnitrophica bacterium]|nr:fused MFS/spermidine synthase [Candidatus Omnitrophota bacterium]
MKKQLSFALILIGFSAMAGQIILMREFLVVFYGNELSLGITLASWLFWMALGSWGLGRWMVERISQRLVILSLGEIILAFILPLSVLAVRLVPLWLHYLPGEIIGVLPMSLATFILLAPICLLGGFLFVLGCQTYKTHVELDDSNGIKAGPARGGASQIGYVYILEAIGASVGGLITSLLLIRLLSPIYIMFLLSILNLFSAFLLLRKRRTLAIFCAALIIVFIFLISSGQLYLLRQHSLSLQWRDYKLLTSQNSVYGNIAITRRKELFSVFSNGLYSFTVPDDFSSESKAHLPLLQHPDPKKVLLIGGGSSGQLQEVLKHPVERVDYVELDPLLISLAREFLPPNEALDDPRVRIITNMDARLFIKRSKESYDVVIINLPSPNTAQLNRFYTKEFYAEAENVLKSDGILCFSMQSNPNYISTEQKQLYLTLERTLESVFSQVEITPGETNFFFASNKKGILTLDWQVLIERLKKRSIQARYVREYYLFSEFSQERIDSFKKMLAQSKAGAINTDFKPIAYYYNLVLWNTYFKYNLKKLFKFISPKKIYIATAFIYVLLLWPIWFRIKGRRFANWGVLTCMGTTGFAEITFQIITLLSFQVLYGYVYYKLGIILTSYMIGLIFGSWCITKRLEKQDYEISFKIKTENYKLFSKTQIAIFIYPLMLPLLFWLFLNLKGRFSFWLGSNIIFPLLPLIPGFIGGFQFPLANSLNLEANALGVSRSAGLTYGIDLFGSCLGAILTSIFLIPMLGIPLTCLLVAGLNLAGLILLKGYSLNTSAEKI